jgi:hypothetical protein
LPQRNKPDGAWRQTCERAPRPRITLAREIGARLAVHRAHAIFASTLPTRLFRARVPEPLRPPYRVLQLASASRCRSRRPILLCAPCWAMSKPLLWELLRHEHLVRSRVVPHAPEPCLPASTTLASSHKSSVIYTRWACLAVDYDAVWTAGETLLKLAEVSRLSRIQIVARPAPPAEILSDATGQKLGRDDLPSLFVRRPSKRHRCLDYSGPIVAPHAARAGFCDQSRGGKDRFLPREEILRCGGFSSARHRLPILTHTEEGTAAAGAGPSTGSMAPT